MATCEPPAPQVQAGIMLPFGVVLAPVVVVHFTFNPVGPNITLKQFWQIPIERSVALAKTELHIEQV